MEVDEAEHYAADGPYIALLDDVGPSIAANARTLFLESDEN